MSHREEEIPEPTADARRRARQIEDWAVSEHFWVSTDIDVLGGVAAHIHNGRDFDHFVWVACMNNGATTVVLSCRGATLSGMFTEDSKAIIIEFLRGNVDAAWLAHQ